MAGLPNIVPFTSWQSAGQVGWSPEGRWVDLDSMTFSFGTRGMARPGSPVARRVGLFITWSGFFPIVRRIVVIFQRPTSDQSMCFQNATTVFCNCTAGRIAWTIETNPCPLPYRNGVLNVLIISVVKL